MSIEFNIDIPKLIDLMDQADGNANGHIDKKVWNNFNTIFETNKIKNYKTVEDANDIITKYFDKITKSNNPQSFAAAALIYNKLMGMAMDLAVETNSNKIIELLDKINNQLKAVK